MPAPAALPTTPLAGVRVLDFTSVVAGPLATQVLADQGADVIKVEPPGLGDLGRLIGAMTPAGFGYASSFLALNRAKRSIALDLKRPEGQDAARRLALAADVVIHNFRPGVAERLGLGAEGLLAEKPSLIVCEITGFGHAGPLADERAYDPIIQAQTGMAAVQGGEGEPQLIRQFICDKVAGLTAAQAIAAALFRRGRVRGRGTGGRVGVSLLDASAAFAWADMLWGVVFQDAAGAAPDLGEIYAPWPTKDGALVAVVVSDKEFAGFMRTFGKESEKDNPAFANMLTRLTQWSAVRAVFAPAIAELTCAEALEKLHGEDVPAAKVASPAEVAADPQIAAVGLVEEQTHPAAGRVRLARAPVVFDGARAPLGRPAPALGQDGRAVLKEAGFSGAQIDALAASGVVSGLTD